MPSVFEMYPTSQSEIDEIYKSFDKSQANVDEDVAILKEWLKKQPHLPQIESDDFLRIHLIRNKFRMEQTKIKLDNYFTMKTFNADIFDDNHPEHPRLAKLKDNLILVPMPNLTKDYSRVIYSSVKVECDFEDTLLFALLQCDQQLYGDYSSTVTYIVNWKNVTFKTVQSMKPALVVKALKNYTEGCSGRIKEYVYVNAPPFIDVVLSILKVVMPAKLFSRIKIYKDTESLINAYGAQVLPEELGGTAISAEKLNEKFWQFLMDHKDDIIRRNHCRSTENLRIGKPYLSVDNFGVDGTFKKINID